MSKKQNIQLHGTSISPGMASGRAFVYHDVLEEHVRHGEIQPHRTDDEFARLEEALAETARDLAQAAERVENEVSLALADIFRAHREILEEPRLREELRQKVHDEFASAEKAVSAVLMQWEQQIQSVEGDAFPQRGEDISDLRRRVLKALRGVQAHGLEAMPEGSVLVTHRLLPSDAAFFSQRRPAAVVVESGSPGSHCALLSREMGIPGVVQLPGVVEKISGEPLILVDGLQGRVIIDPDEPGRREFKRAREKYNATLIKASRESHQPAVTTDGVEIPVMANIGSRADSKRAAQNGADGVGLYRTEMLFTSRQILPTEEELVEEMWQALSPLEGRSITVRLLDIGGDKNLPYLDFGAESNPFLGRRGIRLLLYFRRLLNLQLRAVLRLTQRTPLKIMIPFVTTAGDVKQVRETVRSLAQEMGIADVPPVGAMIETPAAALAVEDILKHADFLSIGTNDLTQYTMAAGRDNPSVAQYFRDDHPAVLRLLRMVCDVASDMPVSVCGELAGRLGNTETLLQAGVRELSVAPPVIPSVKQSVRDASVGANDPGRD